VSESFDFEPLIDTKEGARLLKFTEQRIRRLAQRKLIPAARYGREWLFRRSEFWIVHFVTHLPVRRAQMFSPYPVSSTPVGPKRPRGRPRNNS
jgi:excisionase family DNA binding protein